MTVALYLRVSTDQQTLEPQRIELTKYCEARGWTIAAEFTDVISGAKASREGINELMARMRKGEFGAVLAVKIDRIARSMSNFAMIYEELSKHGVALVISSQGIDTSNDNPTARLHMQILGAFAEFERNLIRERTRAGMAAAKARGSKIGHPSTRLVPNHAEVLAEWKAEGGRHLRDLASRLGGVSVSFAHTLATRAA